VGACTLARAHAANWNGRMAVVEAVGARFGTCVQWHACPDRDNRGHEPL